MAAGTGVEPDIELARGMFDSLRAHTSVGRAITRATYGEGENFAHGLARKTAEGLGLEIKTDAALPQGGNYDGAAGVVAGLSALGGLRRQAITPERDVTVMAIRAEEAAWFNSAYIGSHASFGRLDPQAFDVRRADSGRPLAEHLAEAGGDVAALRRGQAHLDPKSIAAFIEVHIEQGPVLEAKGLPIGLVTGIRGCLRHAHAHCFGAYAHSGAATVELLQRLNEHWLAVEEAGEDLVFTVGQLNTDPAVAAPSKVAGETSFVLDFRGLKEKVMRDASATAETLAAEIAQRHRVRFELGEGNYSYPAILDAGLRRRFSALAQDLGLPAMELASGAGHDSAVFTEFGVPSAMIFIRNAHGSHNPEEAMELADFAAAARLLANFLAADKP